MVEHLSSVYETPGLIPSTDEKENQSKLALQTAEGQAGEMAQGVKLHTRYTRDRA